MRTCNLTKPNKNISTELQKGKASDLFRAETEEKQGDAMSTLVFNPILDYVIKDVGPSETIFTKTSQIWGFADDLDILARNMKALKSTPSTPNKSKILWIKNE